MCGEEIKELIDKTLDENKEQEEALVHTHLRTREKIYTSLKMYESKNHTIAEIIEATGISQTTLYRYIKLNKEE